MPAAEIDVLVVGGGPVGCSFALALRGSAQRVVVLERDAGGARSAASRPLALSYASRLILERVGAWGLLVPSPIETILVSQAGAFGRARLSAADAGVPALGYVVEYRDLASALAARLESSGIEIRRGVEARALAPRCVVHAEGVSEDARETRYAQEAVVGVVETEPRAGTTAHERARSRRPPRKHSSSSSHAQRAGASAARWRSKAAPCIPFPCAFAPRALARAKYLSATPRRRCIRSRARG